MAFLDKESKSVSVFVEVSRGKSLVGSVEEWIQVLLFADIRDSLPFFRGWVDSSWIVSTSVKKHNRSSLCVREVSNHSFDVKTLSLWAIVSILSYLKSSSSKDFVVVSPSWVTHIDWSFSPLVKKLRGNS